MTTRSIVTALATALMLVWGSPVFAQQTRCLAGKTKCMSKKGAGLLKCEQLAETPGKVPDRNAGGCVDKVIAKFDGGVDPAKGCFEKLENKNPNDCITFDDTASAEQAVDSSVALLVAAIDPPPLDQTKCGAGKKKCVSKYFGALLKCHQLAQTLGKPNDPNANGCVDKAMAKYNGGAEPPKGCFEKLENKSPNDCQFSDDTATLQGLVESSVAALVDVVTDTTTTSSTTGAPMTTTTTSMPPPPGVVLKRVLPASAGLFNYTPMQTGVPGASTRCNVEFSGSHACTYAELQAAEAAGDLDGIKDTTNVTVTSFWAIDSSQPAVLQCTVSIAWDYATAHTGQFGQKVNLNNGTGVLGPLMSGAGDGVFCAGASWVGCCS